MTSTLNIQQFSDANISDGVEGRCAVETDISEIFSNAVLAGEGIAEKQSERNVTHSDSIVGNCDKFSCEQSKSEETPRSVRSITDEEAVEISECSTNLKFISRDCVLSTPPITPTIENRKQNKHVDQRMEIVTPQTVFNNTRRTEMTEQSDADAAIVNEEAKPSDQRNFCPTVEELDFFR
jgi:hypothetical protein